MVGSQASPLKVLMVTPEAVPFAKTGGLADVAGVLPRELVRLGHDVRLLVCEDVQILGPRRETQQQLLAAIDEVLDGGGLVLLTSTRMPGEIEGLSRKLVNRMHGGICANLDPPGEESRRRLIEHFLTVEPVRLSPQEIETVARRYPVSPRELLGLLAQLSLETRARGHNGKQRNLEEILADLSIDSPLRMSRIAKVTARTFGVRVSDLKGPRRSQTITLARQTAMYLARELGRQHYAVIGEYFNRRNHSTVIHACRKIETLLDEDPRLAHDVETIREELVSQ
jgi:chromosomal replication initiator protein